MASVVFGVGETGKYILESVAEAFLSNGGAMSVLSFAGGYGISVTFGNLSDEDLVYVSILLVLSCESSVLGCAGRWVECILD